MSLIWLYLFDEVTISIRQKESFLRTSPLGAETPSCVFWGENDVERMTKATLSFHACAKGL